MPSKRIFRTVFVLVFTLLLFRTSSNVLLQASTALAQTTPPQPIGAGANFNVTFAQGTSDTYTVKPGDSLATIAQQFYGDPTRWRAIYAANTELIGANPRLIRSGQQLHIPELEVKTTYACAGRQMTAEEVAAHRDLDLTALVKLQQGRGLTYEEICMMPPARLQRSLYRVANPKPDQPGEAVAFRRLQLQDENGFIPPDGLVRAAQHIDVMRAAPPPPGAGITNGAWTSIGPGNIGGRTRALLIHPTDPNQIWLGSVAGGIWKSANGGASWQVQNDFMTNMVVSTLVIDPANPDILYAGTGEGFYNGDGLRGAGVFKTTNGGLNWSQLTTTNTPDWYYVNRLAIHPTNGLALLAATRSGIWRSIDGGATWTNVLGNEMLDINFDPTDGSKAIASGYSAQAWYSTNGGVTWTVATGLPAADRIEVAYAPSNPSIVYASVEINSGEIYKSANGGVSYTLVNTGDAFLGSQGWYDNIIWVDPTNADTVIVGGIDLWRSTNGGATLTKISQWFSAPASAHADHHAIVAHPNFNGTTNTTVFFGNDGGIYKTDNVYTLAVLTGWQELNNNLGITQFYGAAANPSGKVYGGTQDNGALFYAGNSENWIDLFGGDGGFAAVDPTDPNYLYGEYTNLQIHRNTTGGVAPFSSSYIHAGISDAGTSNALFIAPFILDPNNANTMLAGGNQLWRSTNVKAATPTWASIKASPGTCCISAIAVAQGNSDIIWVGHQNGNIYKSINGTSGAPTWTQQDTTSPALPNRYVTRLTIDANNTNIVYATFGGFSDSNIWRTTNGGSNWSDVTGSGATGLPLVPVRDLNIYPTNSSWLYAGTEVGIFTSEDNGANWTLPHDGPNNTSVDELFWQGTTLYAATHGRGIFMATPTLASADVAVTKVDASDPVVQGSNITYNINVTNNGPDGASSVTLTDILPTGVNFVSATSSPGSCSHAAGTVTCNLGSLANGASATITIVASTSGTTPALVTNTASVSSTTGDPNNANNSDSETTTVNPPTPASADVAVTKVDASDPVVQGNNITYNINVTNNGPDGASNVTLSDPLPAGVSFVSATPSQGTCSQAAGTVTCNLGSLATGASATVTIVVNTSGTTPASVTNTASVSSATSDPNNANNSDSETTTVNPPTPASADVAVTKVDASDPVVQGNNITYNINVSNNGPNTANSVTLTDILPAGVSFVSATPGSCSHAAGTVTCNLGTLANGASVAVTIVVSTNGSTPASVSNTASVSSTTSDPNNANNSDSETTTVNPPGGAPTIVISSDENDNVPGLSFRDEDIMAYNTGTGLWSLVFDGSDVGLGNVDVDGFAFLSNGHLLLTVDKDFTLSGFGPVDDSDILRFTPSSYGPTTSGSYALYFDGSDVGLDKSDEDVDAIDFDAGGKLLISVNGAFKAPGASGNVTGNDEDLFRLTGTLGATTTGTWDLYFDGSDVGLTSSGEDLFGLWADHANSKLYLSTHDNFKVTGASGDEDDIFVCLYTSLGNNTACTFSVFWNGDNFGFDDDAIDGLSIGTPPVVVSAAGSSATAAMDDTVEFVGDDANEVDPLDGEEIEDEATQSIPFLPLVQE